MIEYQYFVAILGTLILCIIVAYKIIGGGGLEIVI